MQASIGWARRRRGVLLGLAVLSSVGCGYSLAGRGSFLPDYIRTIGVPLFVNGTPYYEVDQILTEKVRSEFAGRGKYRVLPDTTGVDAVLSGEISSISIAPASFTADQQASRYVFTLVARIEFRDLKSNQVVWENRALTFRDEYEVASGDGALDPAAFFGQQSNAVDRITEQFAKAVVSAILEAF